jgi:Tyrosyl-DNA phosphodiesterase
MARSKPDAQDGVRLLDLWSPSPDAGSPVGCVATTYTFDPTHFEEQCLGRFLRMESDPAEGLRAYLIEREEKLSEAFVCVLADQRNVAAQRSLRWHLLSVRLPEPAIQHSKLMILVWERHLRILIGSANLTEPGYRSNLETVVSFDFFPERGPPTQLVSECLDYIEGLAAFTPGTAERAGPRRELADFLTRTRERIRDWRISESSTAVHCELIPLLPTGQNRSVFAQLKGVWQGPAPMEATVLSPFFDQSDDGIDRVYRELASLMTSRGDRQVSFASSGRETPTRIIQIDIPERLVKSPLRHPSMTHSVGYVADRQTILEIDALRRLHSKVIILDRDRHSIAMIGSSNFTAAGLGLTPRHNAELNVAYRIPASEGEFYRRCEGALPPINWLDDEQPRELIQGSEQSEDVGAALAVLPSGFAEALYRPDIDGGSLELWFEPDGLPSQFVIRVPSGLMVLDTDGWRTRFASAHRVTLPLQEPVSGLTVQWRDRDGEPHSAVWPVNVSDVSLLIPPAELRNLALEDLILVLTSARPAFRVLIERAEAKKSSRPASVEIDPHRRVDTSRFLLKRMRLLAKALEGLRLRLERPVCSLEGWRWRLHGPFGPVALARALKVESGHEAPFFVSEIAATLKEIRLVAGPGVTNSALQQELNSAISILRSLSFGHAEDMPANLAEYVHEIFRESVT